MINIIGQLYRPVFQFFLLAFFIVLTSTGCKSSQKSAAPVIRETRNPEDKLAPDLEQLITDSSFKAKTLTAKASVQAVLNEEENSFNINLRIYTDSAIWISINSRFQPKF